MYVRVTAYVCDTKNVLEPIKDHITITETNISEIQKDAIVLKDKSKIPYGACIWMAASVPSPLVKVIQTKSKSTFRSFLKLMC
jgi:NADH dehydrogenase FAD-containing subunit